MRRFFLVFAFLLMPLVSAWSVPINEPVTINLPYLDHQPAALVPDAPPTPIARQSIAYVIANRPLTAWRRAVDAYQHIDPGRRSI